MSRYKKFWVCSVCGTPRRSTYLLPPAKICWNCKTSDSNYLVIQEKQDYKSKESLSRSKRSREVISIVKDNVVGVIASPIRDILSLVAVERVIQFPVEEMFVQAFFGKQVQMGNLNYDPCMFYVPKEVREIMSKTKMMQIRIPAGLHKWFKRYTQEHEITMTHVVISYLERLRAKAKSSSDVEQI